MDGTPASQPLRLLQRRAADGEAETVTQLPPKGVLPSSELVDEAPERVGRERADRFEKRLGERIVDECLGEAVAARKRRQVGGFDRRAGTS